MAHRRHGGRRRRQAGLQLFRRAQRLGRTCRSGYGCGHRRRSGKVKVRWFRRVARRLSERSHRRSAQRVHGKDFGRRAPIRETGPPDQVGRPQMAEVHERAHLAFAQRAILLTVACKVPLDLGRRSRHGSYPVERPSCGVRAAAWDEAHSIESRSTGRPVSSTHDVKQAVALGSKRAIAIVPRCRAGQPSQGISDRRDASCCVAVRPWCTGLSGVGDVAEWLKAALC
jgi:hypothetical protein